MNNKINFFLEKTTLPMLEELEKQLFRINAEFRIQYTDIPERSMVQKLQNLNKPLDGLIEQIRYMFSPVVKEGTLFLNDNRKYQITNTEHYLSAGEFCEALLPYNFDDVDEYLTWIPTRIEFSKQFNQYYFTERPNISMNGVTVRVRKRT